MDSRATHGKYKVNGYSGIYMQQVRDSDLTSGNKYQVTMTLWNELWRS